MCWQNFNNKTTKEPNEYKPNSSNNKKQKQKQKNLQENTQ